MSHVVVVGASVGGVTCVQSLRELGFDGDLTLLDAEDGPPYQRPPLSKEVLLGGDAAHADLLDESALEAIGVEFRPGTPAVGLDVAGRRLRLAHGDLRFDALVLATGAAAAVPAPLTNLIERGAHVLRTRGDAVALAAALGPGSGLAVLGGGVLGSEIVSAAVSRGVPTTLLARTGQTLGPLRGALVQRLLPLHRSRGVAVQTDRTRISRGAGRWRIDAGAARHVADTLVIAVGVRAAAGWLERSLPVGPNGVRCDSRGRVAPGVWAVGDVADRAGGRYDVSRNTQAAAVAQAREVAGAIAGDPLRVPVVPYFWSDLHGVRVQAAGRIPPGVRIQPLDRDDAGAPLAFAVVDADGTVVGAAAWGSARGFRRARAMLGTPLEQEVVAR
ncbi:NAD(P)/FAD-dependent oxidoreductase [Occultella aeris]|uniref:Benzene 1,2-dioxygenase system ferredoxin--NAD(+) reductase subunit n=1 Tax=Occultella aeris TaxID=2761496 RepID=A0A7M4DH36_9MICO|nr:FAD-dependent oxidoreductase [Occultella aeris]VZO36229.1 Benzene 1,2-dioxygenase system ferredoxin--NAD(+) reductase subunit [Occultella aeris]